MKKLLVVAVAMATAGISGQAAATNGYFTHGLGTINKAMAGAGTANPQEAMAAALNPASAVLVGDRTEAGVAVFSPLRDYTASDSMLGQLPADQMMAAYGGGAFTIDGGNIESGSNYHFIPHYAKTWKLDNTTGIGLAIYGRGGMNTDYGNDASASYLNPLTDIDPATGAMVAPLSKKGTFGAGPAGVNLSQLFVDMSYSAKTGELAYGASLVLAAQGFEATGLMSFMPYTTKFNNAFGAAMPAAVGGAMQQLAPAVEAGMYTEEQAAQMAMQMGMMSAMGSAAGAFMQDNKLSNNGMDLSYGVGFGLGAIWTSDALNVSLQYKSKISMSEFDDYSDLFAEGGGFDIPSSFGLGMSFKAQNGSVFNYDFEQINYTDVSSVANPIANLFSCPIVNQSSTSTAGCLGGSKGAGFGWTDVQVHKLGYEWSMAGNSKVRYRVGYSFGENPIGKSEVLFNILAPAVIVNHMSAGFTRELGDGTSYSVSLMYAPEESTKATSPFDPTQTIEIAMDEWELEFSYSW